MKIFVQIFALLVLSSQILLASPPKEKGLASYYDNSFHGRKTASGVKYDKSKFTAAHKTLPFGTKVKVVNPANGKSVVVEINDRGPYIKGRIIELSRKAAEQIGMIKKAVVPVEIEVVSAGTKVSTPVASAPVEKKKVDLAAEKTAAKPAATKVPVSKSSTAAKKAKIAKKSKADMVVKAQEMEAGGLYKMQVLKLKAKGYGVQVAGYSDYQAVVQQLAVLQKNWFKGATVFVDKLNGKPYYKIILGPMATKEEASSYSANIKKKYGIKDAFVVDMAKLSAKAKK